MYKGSLFYGDVICLTKGVHVQEITLSCMGLHELCDYVQEISMGNIQEIYSKSQIWCACYNSHNEQFSLLSQYALKTLLIFFLSPNLGLQAERSQYTDNN